MFKKINKFLQNKNTKKVVCWIRGVVGETILAALAVAYIAEHINQINHKYAVGVGTFAVALVLYFAHANKIK